LFGTYPVGRFGEVTITGISGYLAKGRPREGSWQLRTAATPLLLAGASKVLPVEVVLETTFHHLKIKKVGKAGYLQGQLWSEAGPLKGQKVTLHLRNQSGTHERTLTSVTTGSNGAFSIKLPATRWWYQARSNGAPQSRPLLGSGSGAHAARAENLVRPGGGGCARFGGCCSVVDAGGPSRA
jgi:hypothetical protein